MPHGSRPRVRDAFLHRSRNLPASHVTLVHGIPVTTAARTICDLAGPLARKELQKRGVLLMRDASANKCGVISSSYEIIANLLLDEDEFLINKKELSRALFKKS